VRGRRERVFAAALEDALDLLSHGLVGHRLRLVGIAKTPAHAPHVTAVAAGIWPRDCRIRRQ
jgi:hypothetical protein